MRHLSGVILATTAFVAGCMLDEEPAPELGEVTQAAGPGDFTQGNYTHGTQGDDAVWGFKTTGWLNSGFKLKNTGVVKGQLTAKWDRSPACGPYNHALGRTCDWHSPGHTYCAPNSSVTLRAGGCAANPAQRSMIRVCSGRKPCTYAAALATTDAVCSGTTNPSVTFTCPSTGRYFLMVGPKAAGFGTPSASFTYTVQPPPFTMFSNTFSSADFNGTTLDGEHDGGFIRYKITADPQLLAADTAGTSSLYTLHEDTPAATPLCIGDNHAIPFIGRWFPDGTLQTNSDTFTFGCTIGVIAKCYMRGYFPWAAHDGESLRDYHQSCTRAARGDFCASGGSYTVNGTTIDLYDGIGYVDETVDEPSSSMRIEAIWRRDVIEASDEFRIGIAPVCLSKKRWETIPYDAGGLCPTLDDPRIDTHLDYCEDRPLNEWLENDRNVIVTESANYDAGLWRWRRGGKFRSTTQCDTTADESDCTDEGYELDASNDPAVAQPVFLGAVYHWDLEADLRPNTIPLYTHRRINGDDYITTTASSVPGFEQRTPEGYILASCAAPPCTALKLFAGQGAYVTSVEAPPAPYQEVETLGYLPAPRLTP